MVRNSALRASKFASKVDPAVISARITAQRDSMISQVNQTSADAVTLENSVKSAIEAGGVSSIQIPFYLSFARELAKTARKFDSKDSGATGGIIAQALKAKWVARGLDSATLITVAGVVGYTVT